MRPQLPLACGFAALIVTVGLAGCEPDTPPPEMAGVERPVLQNKADSVAMVLYDSLGGPEAWASLPYLRFNFGFERDGERIVRNRHLWNRQAGDYRLEWTEGADSNYVALFNVNTQEGQVYLNGQPVDSTRQTDLLQRAYRSFINDTYWLMAPVKVFDPGVTRTYVADSSGGEHDVIRLTFDDVGLTPGDTYWFYVNKNTGRMDRWAMMLQNMPSDAAPRVNRWQQYETLEAPEGPVLLATRKEAPGQNFAIVTDGLEAPQTVPDDLFTDPNPRME